MASTHENISYGIICCNDIKSYEISTNLKVLLIMKRNSYSYIEFLRGKYNLLDTTYIQVLFNNMTVLEKEYIVNNNFIYLWNTLWQIKKYGKTDKRNKSNFYNGIIKFNIIKKGYINQDDPLNKKYDLRHYIENSKKHYKYPEWFFPKGKININEDAIECATREFEEETNIIRDDIEIFENSRLEVVHVGTNKKEYKTVFFLAKYKKNTDNLIFRTKNKYQRQEIGSVKWINYSNLVNTFRDTEHYKLKLIGSLFNKIKRVLKS